MRRRRDIQIDAQVWLLIGWNYLTLGRRISVALIVPFIGLISILFVAKVPELVLGTWRHSRLKPPVPG